MSEVLFDVVFKGKFSNEIDKSKAVLHFSKLFKLPVSKAEMFFDGKPRSLKKSLNLDKASHFRKALKKAGLRVSLVKQYKETPKPDMTMSAPGVVIVNAPFVQPKHYDTSQFILDEVGVKIVEKQIIEKVEFDLTGLEVDDVGAELAEKKSIPVPEYDIANITIEEVGALFDKKQIIPEPDLDISDMSMDEIGAIMSQKKTIPEPDINIDNIELVEG